MNNIYISHFTLDFDLRVITGHAKQEGTKKRYHSNKQEQLSYHPRIAFVSDGLFVANIKRFRNGKNSSANNFLSFFRKIPWP
jgi:enolase